MTVISFTEADAIIEITCIARQYSKEVKIMYKYLNFLVTYWTFLSDRERYKKNNSLK